MSTIGELQKLNEREDYVEFKGGGGSGPARVRSYGGIDWDDEW